MRMKHFAAILLAGISTIAVHSVSSAQNAPALTGEVRSAEEGAMAGVTVTATRDKSSSFPPGWRFLLRPFSSWPAG